MISEMSWQPVLSLKTSTSRLFRIRGDHSFLPNLAV